MKDRKSANPGRVLVTPENGSAAFYATLTRADNPIEEGDALNKANLLTDEIAALLGLGENAVPNDAFGKLSEINLHWWKRRTEESGYVEKRETASMVRLSQDTSQTNNGNRFVHYADSYTVDENGIITLINSQRITYSYSKHDSQQYFLRGKYFVVNTSTSVPTDLRTIYYWDAENTDTVCEKGGVDTYFVVDIKNPTQISYQYHENIGEYEYVSSPNRNAYPDSGTEGIFSYQYLAVPFENAREGARIATGSYVGTGTYRGEENKCSLTFSFAPKLFILGPSRTPNDKVGTFPDGYGYGNLVGNGDDSAQIVHMDVLTPNVYSANLLSNNATYKNHVTKSEDGKTIHWYLPTGDSAHQQFNLAGTEYFYIVIG